MRILVIGKTGQLARCLAERGAGRAGLDLLFLSRPEIELTKPSSVELAIAAARPNIVVNAAAYTAVDAAEGDPETARLVNAVAAGVIAAAARRAGARMIQISTDYVFDGRKGAPYVETDAPNPLSVYGATKLEGERACLAEGATVVRTAWVYSPYGRNFVGAMLALAQSENEIAVVADQFGSPTGGLDVADALFRMADGWTGSGRPAGKGEIYHCAGAGGASRAELAREIFAASRALGGAHAAVTEVRSADRVANAARPADSRLDCARFGRDFGRSPPDWRGSVRDVVGRLSTRKVEDRFPPATADQTG